MATSKEALRAKFDKYDKDGSGHLSIDEFFSALSSENPSKQFPTDLESRSKLLTLADTDHDGTISFSEWCQLYDESRLLAVFRSFDQNGDGVISLEELRVALSSHGASLTTAQLRRCLKLVDLDKDKDVSGSECEVWAPLLECDAVA